MKISGEEGGGGGVAPFERIDQPQLIQGFSDQT